MNVEIIGFTAGLLTTISFAFQVLKIIQTPCKRQATEGISVMMYFSFVVGVSLWLTYGVLINSFPVIIWNMITLLLASTVFVITLRFHGPLWFKRLFE